MEAEQNMPSDLNPARDRTDNKVSGKSLVQIIREWPLSRKIATLALLLITVTLFTILIIQARVADQQLLYANLAEQDAAQVGSWLKSQRIRYSLKNGGKNIWIPADKIYEARLDLAAQGLPRGGGVGYEVFDNQSLTLTDYVQKVNHTKVLQGELARTIASLEPIESTRVHLAIPEKRLFKEQQKQATASVIVNLVPGKLLSPEQVKGIVHLVAGSITGLEPDNVTIINSRGVVLKADDAEDKEKLLSTDMLAFQQEVEQRLELRAQDLLDKTMGVNKAIIRVTATLDFSKIEKTEELFDPDEPVIRSEQANLQGLDGTAAATSPGSSKSYRTTNYEISKTISKIINPVGTLTKLSVSVLVADKTVLDENGEQSTVSRSDEEIEAITNMVSAALGLTPKRGDQINVLSMPFIEPNADRIEPEEFATESVYQFIPIIKIFLLLFGAILLYFLLIRPIIRTMKGEVTQHYEAVEQLEKEHDLTPSKEEIPEQIPSVDDHLVRLRQEVMGNQVPTAFIIKNWIREG